MVSLAPKNSYFWGVSTQHHLIGCAPSKYQNVNFLKNAPPCSTQHCSTFQNQGPCQLFWVVVWASLKPKLQFKAKFREERRSDEQKRKALAECGKLTHICINTNPISTEDWLPVCDSQKLPNIICIQKPHNTFIHCIYKLNLSVVKPTRTTSSGEPPSTSEPPFSRNPQAESGPSLRS